MIFAPGFEKSSHGPRVSRPRTPHAPPRECRAPSFHGDPGGGKNPETPRAPTVTVAPMQVIRHTHAAAARAPRSSAADT
ncbi:hypothetical protein STVIR_0298 [Streptomyces viridochromogenes Tue57]|uniref:Uncharacterized protein n=1 Tax=Streptomyces viridochromogenes Tue57 TaxID=1160705 RepID=L8PRX2_STRVR|nr:hypothetical protein STVIR_0298 [Streptomyces viridochromogenes Tue57]